MAVPLGRGLPPARLVDLPGRGTTAVRECSGPPGAPTLVLLHGVTLTADLNWFGVLPALGRTFRVIAFDQRGHGRGVDPGLTFRLEDCADDAAALLRAVGAERATVVGYSMGGLVAQLLWRRHPELVDGLVLCSSGRNFRGSPLERLMAMALPTVVALTSMTLPLHWLGAHLLGASVLGVVHDGAAREWAQAEMAQTRLPTAVAAVQAVCDFSSHDWIGGVDVPAAVVVTTRDQLVPPSRQRRLAAAIPGGLVYELDGDHGVFLDAPDRFAEVVVAACTAVTGAVRAAADGPPRRAPDQPRVIGGSSPALRPTAR